MRPANSCCASTTAGVIDTKGWNDWEWTHGVGLYGMWSYYEKTGDARPARS